MTLPCRDPIPLLPARPNIVLALAKSLERVSRAVVRTRRLGNRQIGSDAMQEDILKFGKEFSQAIVKNNAEAVGDS